MHSRHNPDLGDIQFADDTSAAGWVVEGIRGFGVNVGSIIPAGFPAYARIFHPASVGPDRTPVRWSEIAAANGRVMHPEAQFEAISGIDPWQETQPGIWDDAPEEGELPYELRTPLVEILREHTATPDKCWFGIWEGWGGLRIPRRYRVRVHLPNRDYVLVIGPITAILGSFRKLYRLGPDMAVAVSTRDGTPPPDVNRDEYPFPDEGASLWWPDDRQWFVATEIDFRWTYVGGSHPLIDALLARSDLEALPVAIEHGVTATSDPINPLPEGTSR